MTKCPRILFITRKDGRWFPYLCANTVSCFLKFAKRLSWLSAKSENNTPSCSKNSSWYLAFYFQFLHIEIKIIRLIYFLNIEIKIIKLIYFLNIEIKIIKLIYFLYIEIKIILWVYLFYQERNLAFHVYSYVLLLAGFEIVEYCKYGVQLS